ncbi:MAG: Ig-like domain-containing protein, partial [Heliobacteriaceae bacterium]|nr:Ig-like domain-containing protein [Heliobacteriaceae bacterium]
MFNWVQEVVERFRNDNIEEATRWDKNLLLYQFNQSNYDGSGCQTHMLLIFYPPGEEPTPPNPPPGPPPPPPGTSEDDKPVPPPPVDPDPDDHENATPIGGGTIPPPPPQGEAGFSISPTTLTITVGKTQQFTAYYKSALETTRKTVTNSTSWTSSNPAVATISNGGLLTAVTAGTVTITGSYSGKSELAKVTVNTIEELRPPEYGGDHLAGCGLFLFDEPGGYVNHPVTVGVSLVKNAEEPVSWGDSANGGLITVTYTLLTPSLYYENNGWQEAQAAKTIVTQTWYTIPGESGVDEEGNEWSTPDELVTNPPETTDETITCSHLFNQIDRGAPLIWIYDAANNVGDIDQYIYYKNDDQPPIRINFLI